MYIQYIHIYVVLMYMCICIHDVVSDVLCTLLVYRSHEGSNSTRLTAGQCYAITTIHMYTYIHCVHVHTCS